VGAGKTLLDPATINRTTDQLMAELRSVFSPGVVFEEPSSGRHRRPTDRPSRTPYRDGAYAYVASKNAMGGERRAALFAAGHVGADASSLDRARAETGWMRAPLERSRS
jgi:hypothetical protein